MSVPTFHEFPSIFGHRTMAHQLEVSRVLTASLEAARVRRMERSIRLVITATDKVTRAFEEAALAAEKMGEAFSRMVVGGALLDWSLDWSSRYGHKKHRSGHKHFGTRAWDRRYYHR